MREKLPNVSLAAILGALCIFDARDPVSETAEEVVKRWEGIEAPKPPPLPECLKQKCPAPVFNATNRAERRRQSRETRRK